MAGLESTDSTRPTGSEFVREGDNAVRELKAALLAFAALAHHLDGSHKFGIGPAASRPAAGKAGNFWILTAEGVAVELQYDTGVAWTNLTNNQIILNYVASLTAHATADPIDHPDESITGAKIATGTIVTRNFDAGGDNTSVAPLVNGGDADPFHAHPALVAMFGAIPEGITEEAITGDFVVHGKKLFTVGDDLVISSDSNKDTTSVTTPVKMKEIRLGQLTKAGSALRVKFTLAGSASDGFGGSGPVNATEFSEDFAGLNPDDLIQIYAYRHASNGRVYGRVYINGNATGILRDVIGSQAWARISNFRIYYTENTAKFHEVTLA